MKIYIIGPTGAGKSTLANILSKKMNIRNYELDLLVYDDEHDHVKRSDKEIEKLFNKILKNDSWIIEDVGRSKFSRGRGESDKIYYLKLSKLEVYKRVILRWIKQRMGKLSYNYPPTLYALIDMIKVTNSYFKKEKTKLEQLEPYKDKIEFLSKKGLNKLEKYGNLKVEDDEI